MPHLNFTIDSALLRELGERLVGKPHIALAELVKNSFDADASKVIIRFLPDEDRIEVQDDGHGMDFDDFKNFWMRIGTTHKDQKRESKNWKRAMTGSKGVGRLSVQFLASKLELITVPEEDKENWLKAGVDWDEAISAGDLTKASVMYNLHSENPPFEQGTLLVLKDIKQQWSAESVQLLARELWWLQPPFRSSANSGKGDPGLRIEFESNQKDFETIFNLQMRAILAIWSARVIGKNEQGHVSLAIQFEEETPQAHEFHIKDLPHNHGEYDSEINLDDGSFEIRVFKLSYRQPHGIKVDDARRYFESHGGVHVYDGGFRLPYYGDPKNDWLRIEVDHSHRKFVSELLPEKLQEKYAHTQRLRYLPTIERLFGVVNVNTSQEPGLKIMITRDRLAEAKAFDDLWRMVRYALDLYAMEEAKRVYEKQSKAGKTLPERFAQIEEVLEYYKPEIPEPVFKDLRNRLHEANETAAANESRAKEEIGLLGALATAGISAVAYQHELTKQFGAIRDIIDQIENIRTNDHKLQTALDQLAGDLAKWIERAEATNALFDYLADAENTRVKQRFSASSVLEDIKRQTRFLARGMSVEIQNIDETLRLPEATLAEWGAIFQNVFINAFNAMLDSEKRMLQVSSYMNGQEKGILVQDTGCGVDLMNAERLFQPFERAAKISSQRRSLGYGGSGLGLTIVRLLSERIGCNVRFVPTENGFKTAFLLSWRERQ